MDNQQNVSLVSKKFWISFVNYYYNVLLKVFKFSAIKGKSLFLNYGYDALLFFGKYI